MTIEPEGNPAPQVINIMDALKKSVQKQSTTKVSDAVRKRMGKTAPKSGRPSSRERPTARARRTVN